MGIASRSAGGSRAGQFFCAECAAAAGHRQQWQQAALMLQWRREPRRQWRQQRPLRPARKESPRFNTIANVASTKSIACCALVKATRDRAIRVNVIAGSPCPEAATSSGRTGLINDRSSREQRVCCSPKVTMPSSQTDVRFADAYTTVLRHSSAQLSTSSAVPYNSESCPPRAALPRMSLLSSVAEVRGMKTAVTCVQGCRRRSAAAAKQ